MREPSVTFAVVEGVANYLIVNLPMRTDTQIIQLDPERGYPSYKGIHDFDIFPSKNAAFASIKKRFATKQIFFEEFYMIAGIFPIGGATIIAFITGVKNVGNFIGNEIYSVSNIKFALANVHQLLPNEQRVLSQITSIGLNSGYFICHTSDVSYPLSGTKTNECVWNESMMKPFAFFPLGKVCPNIISGTFSAENIGDHRIYYITRIVSETWGPAENVRGTTPKGGLGNMASVEVVISKKTGITAELYSFILLRGTVPIAFSKETGAVSYPPYSNLPGWIHRTTENYNARRINIFDLGNSASTDNDTISTALQESIEFVKENFQIKLKQLDWLCMKRDGMKIDAVTSIKEYVNILCKGDYFSHGFVDRGKVSFDKKQSSVIVVTSPNGIDRAAIGTYIVISSLLINILKNSNVEEALRSNIGSFIAMSTIDSSDIIARQSVGTDSLCHKDIVDISPISKKSRSIHIQKNKVIIFDRKKNTYESQAKLMALSILSGQNEQRFLPSPFTPVNDLITCVSDVPGARAITPACGTRILQQNRTTYRISEGPLIVLLSEPCYVTEIAIKVPSSLEHLSVPSSFNVYGGAYANRLFNVFEDKAIPLSEEVTTYSYFHSNDAHYSQEPIASSLSLVRFLVFNFDALKDSFVIDGIRIYGKRTLPPSIDPYPVPLQGINMNPQFKESPTHETFIAWEEKRLSALMPIKDYMYKLIKIGINPCKALSESMFKLMPSALNHDYEYHCIKCGKPADFRCGLCRKTFCKKCSKMNDNHDQISDPHSLSRLCDNCIESRYKSLANLSRMNALKKRMATELFDFLEKEDGRFYSNNPVLLYQVPLGANNVSFEKMMTTGEKWEPAESSIRVNFLFKQYMKINALTVRCNTQFSILVDEKPFVCSPPFQRLNLDEEGTSISLMLLGDNISISGISFETEQKLVPLRSIERPALATNYQVVKAKTSNAVGKYMKLVPIFENEQQPIAGIEFNEIAPIKSIACLLKTNEGPKFYRFCLPRFRGPAKVFFPDPTKCNEITIYFTETYEKFIQPQVKLLLIL